MAVLTPTRTRAPAPRPTVNFWIAWTCLALAWSSAPRARAEPALVRDYQIEAIFVYNFAQFVEWPNQAFEGAHAPFVIGILGDDPFGSYIDRAVVGERVDDRPIAIQRFGRVEDIGTCHILFISKSEYQRIDQILATLKSRCILTVSDIDDFNQLGGMIRFVTNNNKVRLRINIGAAKAAGLRISSKLLRPAEIVQSTPDAGIPPQEAPPQGNVAIVPWQRSRRPFSPSWGHSDA